MPSAEGASQILNVSHAACSFVNVNSMPMCSTHRLTAASSAETAAWREEQRMTQPAPGIEQSLGYVVLSAATLA